MRVSLASVAEASALVCCDVSRRSVHDHTLSSPQCGSPRCRAPVNGLVVPPSLGAQATPAASAAPPSASTAPQDKWPRQFTADGNIVRLYTPQLDSWDGRTLAYHAAVSIEAPGSKEPTFGVAFATAKTDVDKTTRLVELTNREITRVSFPSAPAANDTYLGMLRRVMGRKKTVTVALDKLEANLAILQEQQKGESQPLKNEPPRVIFSSAPAILVLVDGDPVWRPLGRNRPPADDQHEPDRPEGQVGGALPPPLRRLDAGRSPRGPLGRGGPTARVAREGLEANPGREVRGPARRRDSRRSGRQGTSRSPR